MCENVYHYFSQKYGMKKMAEEFIYGMVDIAHKSRDRHKRVHTFGVLIGKIETESYSPVITDRGMILIAGSLLFRTAAISILL